MITCSCLVVGIVFRSASEFSHFWTCPSFWPHLSPVKISWWYFKRFKSYALTNTQTHTHPQTDTTENNTIRRYAILTISRARIHIEFSRLTNLFLTVTPIIMPPLHVVQAGSYEMATFFCLSVCSYVAWNAYWRRRWLIASAIRAFLQIDIVARPLMGVCITVFSFHINFWL